jgi:hypothetical protein
LVGKLEFSNPVLLAHDEWSWEPDGVVQLISECAIRPAARDELGEYKN